MVAIESVTCIIGYFHIFRHIRRNVSVSRFRSMKLFPKSRLALLNCVSMSDSCVFNVSFIFSIETYNSFVSSCVFSLHFISSSSTSLLSNVLFFCLSVDLTFRICSIHDVSATI